MKAQMKNGRLYIELDVHEATPSTSGKTLGVAGTQGRFQTSVTIIIANAFIYPTRTEKKEEEAEEPKDKDRKAAAKPTSTKRKPAVVKDDEEGEEGDHDDEN
jgi:hypothetical protein